MTGTKLNMKYLLAASSLVTLLAAAPEALGSGRSTSFLDQIKAGRNLKSIAPVIAPVEFIAPDAYNKIIRTNEQRLLFLAGELRSIKDDDGSDDGWDDEDKGPSAEDQRREINANINKLKAEIEQAKRTIAAPDYQAQHEAHLAKVKVEAQVEEQRRLSEQRTYELSQQRIQKELDAQKAEVIRSKEIANARIAEKAAAQSLEALQAQREALISKAKEAHKAKIKLIMASDDVIAKRRLAVEGTSFKESTVDTFDIDAVIALKKGVPVIEDEFDVPSTPASGASSSIPVVDSSKTPVVEKPKDPQLLARGQAAQDRMKAAAEKSKKEVAEKEAAQELIRVDERRIKGAKLKDEIASTVSLDPNAKKRVASQLSGLFGDSSSKKTIKDDKPVGKLKSNAGGSVSALFAGRSSGGDKVVAPKIVPTTSPADLEKLKAQVMKLANLEKSKKKALEVASSKVVQSASNSASNIPTPPPMSGIPTPPPLGDIPPSPSSSVETAPAVSGLLAEIQKGRALKKMVKKEVVAVVKTDEEVRARAQSRLRKVGSDSVSAPIKSAEEILSEKAENARKTEEALAKRAAAMQKGKEQRAAAIERKRLEFIASGVLEEGASSDDLLKAIENETQIKNAEAIAQRNKEEAARMKALADARKEREQPIAKKTSNSTHTSTGIPTPPPVVLLKEFNPELIEEYSEADLRKFLAYYNSLGLVDSEENEGTTSQSQGSGTGVYAARAALMAEIRAVGKEREVEEARAALMAEIRAVGKEKEEAAEKKAAVAKEKEALIEIVAKDPNKAAAVVAEINKLDAANKDILPVEIKANPFSDSEVANLSNKEKAALYIQNLQTQTAEDIDYNNVKNPDAQSKLQMSALNSMLFDIANNLFSNRMLNLAGVAAGEGVAAGDEEEATQNKQVWITGFYGSAKQGSTLNSSGYSSNTGGAAIGADISIGENEANLIGLAYTNARSGFKMKQTKNDKINTTSHIFSIYGQAEIVENLLLQGSASMLKSAVVTKSAKLVDATNYKVATGKFNSNGHSFNSLLSYKFDTESVSLVPNIGFKYGVTFDGAYNEAGTGVYNLSITKKSSKNLSGIVGLKAMMKPKTVQENIHIIPTIDFSVEKILSHKEQNAKVKLKWADREFTNDNKTAKLEKVGYNLGGGVLVKHNNKEISATYNCHLKKKYVSHQGTLKLQLLF